MAGRIWIGILFIVFGTGFLLHQTEVLNLSNVLSMWWPLILIVIGIIQLNNRTGSSFVSGLLFILVGGVFLANNWLDINLTAYIFPLILIVIGLTFLFTRFSNDSPPQESSSLNSFVLFSGNEIKSQSQEFHGGSVTAVFGGSEIDLRNVTLSDKGATIDIYTVFGGAEIKVPENVHVEMTGIPIFGGWGNKTRSHTDFHEELPVLKFNCVAVFGGIEVTN